MSAAFHTLTELLLQARERDILIMAETLGEAVPELKCQFGFDQRSPHHAYDLFTHTALVTTAVPAEPVLRWAALLHDIGKPAAFTPDENGRGHFRRHAALGSRMAGEILVRLGAPDDLTEQVVWLIENHMLWLEEEDLSRRSRQWGDHRLLCLLRLQQADMSSKGTGDSQGLQRLRRMEARLQENTIPV